MKKVYIYFFIALFISPAFSQNTANPIRFANADFVTGNNIINNTFKKENLQSALWNNNYYVVIQFTALPTEQIKQQLQIAGVHIEEYLPVNAYTATIKRDFNFSGAAGFTIASINSIPDTYKVSPKSYTFNSTPDKTDARYFTLTFFSSMDKKDVVAALQQIGVMAIPDKFNFTNTVLIKPDSTKIKNIVRLPFVSFITEQSIHDTPLNYLNTATHGFSSIQSPSGRNLKGKNVSVGVGDNSDITTHIDFTDRVILRHPFGPQAHGTHTSGTTAGAGIIDPRLKGMAPKATIISQWFSDVLLNTPVYVSDNNLIATNNSYHSVALGCPGEGVYDVLSNYIDAQMINYDEVLHVVAAGNDGYFSCSPYPLSFATVKSGWQSAKNVITVGSMDQASYGIAPYSSCGPLKDGRLKPEITTNGFCYSTLQNNTYGASNGTSMSAPVVTGATALLQERYRQIHSGANAKAALIKALLCNNAEDLGKPGPDFKFGFGMLNARKALEAMEDNRYFSNTISTAQNQSYTITVPTGTRRLKVMLYWPDYAASANTAVALVNDLDLTVTTPAAIVHRPLILDAAPDAVNNNAFEGIDHINNIEQVTIENPAAGTYTISIKGYAIPQGPQVYYCTYQADANGVTVEYPFGGETFVPGETETIRWTAYGNETDDFTIEYSTDNGANWNLIGMAASNARSYIWSVPPTISNNYLVRVTRNNTSWSDASDAVFSVLGVPVINALTVPCEGYILLGWVAATGATSYDILQQKGDSMELIGNTTSLSFLINNLNPSVTNWFAVRAKNGSISGRRSYAESGMAASGDCSLANFDNNFKAVILDVPQSGRMFTSTALTSSEQVKLTIKNLDNSTATGPFDCSYQVNNGTIITETVNLPILSLDSYTYSFTAAANLATPGTYQFKAWVKKAGDNQPLDDTVYKTIKQIANPTVSLPVTDGFETTAAKEYNINTLGIDGDDRVDFKTSGTRGRARTFVNTGFALHGNRSITLDQSPDGGLNTDSLLLTYNASNYNTGNQLRFDFYYKNHGQAPNPDNKVWVRGSDTNPWVFAYDLLANQNDLGLWRKGMININDVLDTVVPAQPVTSSFQVKIAQQGNTSANVPNPILDQDDGYTFDDIKISEAINDVAITGIISPEMTGCGSTGSVVVSIRIKNYSSTAFSNVPVSYRVNGGTAVAGSIVSLAPKSTQVFTFNTNASLLADNDYSFDFWITAPADSYSSNDSLLDYHFHTTPVINTFPYLEGFENGPGSWYSKGSNPSWQWGVPAKLIINKAANGTRAFVTNLTGNYNDNELSYLYSPCFDISTLKKPVLSFSHIFEIEMDYDYAWVEYSTGNSNVWKKLGSAGQGTNWYDNTGVDNWRLSKTKWHAASIDIPAFAGIVRFRFVFTSDGGFNLEGIGIDDIRLHEKIDIGIIPPALTAASTPVNGNIWHKFTWGDPLLGPYYILGEINPNGQNLGGVEMQLYTNSSPVRISSNEYYLDRNYVIHSENPFSGPVGVRLYFKDTEANLLINADGCATCGKPNDAYELGITKYSGIASQENGLLADNSSGSYQFILPANTLIIPHGEGYYAEFTVNSFSEFWFSKSTITPYPANNCPASTITYTATGSGTYQWQVNNGSGYVNIDNGPNYAGATTNTLQLINLPTSATGTRYRCLVNGTADYERILRFNFIWNGSVSTNWFIAANWGCNAIPDQYSDVILPGGLNNYPVVNANTTVRSVTTYPGVQVSVLSGVNLSVKGN
jgi:hypothetical protein